VTAPDASGPLPQWTAVKPGGPYEAAGDHGTTWRLWAVDTPPADDPFPAGYRLAPRDDPGNVNYITREHGLYHALDMAGMRIAGDAIRSDPDGARRQLGLEDG
jgi:hypothetical protein